MRKYESVLWELAFLFILSLHHSLNDGRVIGSQVHEAVGDSSLQASQITVQPIPRNWAIRTSHKASKKATEAVYCVLSAKVAIALQRTCHVAVCKG